MCSTSCTTTRACGATQWSTLSMVQPFPGSRYKGVRATIPPHQQVHGPTPCTCAGPGPAGSPAGSLTSSAWVVLPPGALAPTGSPSGPSQWPSRWRHQELHPHHQQQGRSTALKPPQLGWHPALASAPWQWRWMLRQCSRLEAARHQAVGGWGRWGAPGSEV
ncbi:hypothetical protein V8C86DRAFT_3029923 [Haematococcus lacustris]